MNPHIGPSCIAYICTQHKENGYKHVKNASNFYSPQFNVYFPTGVLVMRLGKGHHVSVWWNCEVIQSFWEKIITKIKEIVGVELKINSLTNVLGDTSKKSEYALPGMHARYYTNLESVTPALPKVLLREGFERSQGEAGKRITRP